MYSVFGVPLLDLALSLSCFIFIFHSYFTRQRRVFTVNVGQQIKCSWHTNRHRWQANRRTDTETDDGTRVQQMRIIWRKIKCFINNINGQAGLATGQEGITWALSAFHGAFEMSACRDFIVSRCAANVCVCVCRCIWIPCKNADSFEPSSQPKVSQETRFSNSFIFRKFLSCSAEYRVSASWAA